MSGEPGHCHVCGSVLRIAQAKPKATETVKLKRASFHRWFCGLVEYFDKRGKIDHLNVGNPSEYREYYDDGDSYHKIFKMETS